MKTSRRSEEHSGFTLIELLVVIAILGVLMSLLLPALGRSKASARSAVCLGQLRQLGLAVQMYTDDHGQRLPSAELLPSRPVDPDHPLPSIRQVLAPYLGETPGQTNETTVFKCPGDRTGRFKRERSSYEWNVELNGRRADETRSATMKIVRVEIIAGQEPNRSEETKELVFPPESTPLLLDYDPFHPRPPRPGINCVFLDGHAAPLD